MIIEDRDDFGRLRVPYFIQLIRNFLDEGKIYKSSNFKSYVESLRILRAADWDCETNGYHKWKHRIDRAAEKIFTGI